MPTFKQMLRLAVPLSFTLLIFPVISLAQTTKTERVAPKLDTQHAQALLIVADLTPGEYFAMPPKDPKCSKPNMVCIQMGPPQFSLNATIKSIVYGEASNEKLELVTHSHWGMQKYEKGLNSVLVMLNTDGQVFQMPKYAEIELVSNKKGELFMPVWDGDPIWWLPCSVDELKEEITSSNFLSSLVIPESEGPAHLVERFPEYFLRTENGITPRYAISISKLQAHLKHIKPSIAQMSCKMPRAR